MLFLFCFYGNTAHSFVPNEPLLYPLKTSENLTDFGFSCFLSKIRNELFSLLSKRFHLLPFPPPKDSVSGVFQEVEKGCIGSKWVNSWLSKLQLRKQSHYFGSTQLHATLQLWNYSYFFIEIICSPVDRRAILQVCPACWYLKFSLSKPDTWWISCSSLVVFKRSRKGNPECEILLHSEYLKNR